MRRSHTRIGVAAAAFTATAVVLSGCSGAGALGGDSSDQEINVLSINGPHMQNIQKLTDEYFTKQTGIKVNYTLLPENDMRARMYQEMSSQAGQYDVASLSAFEVPTFSANGWLAPLSDYVAQDDSYDQADVFDTFTSALSGKDGTLYAEPFFGEGSLVMYRTDLFEKAGLTMPANPTWQQIADLAAKVDGTDGAKGICLRGLAGWGQNLAVLTTMVNTFGGTWFDENWDAQLTAPEFKEATQFYVDLIQQHGEEGAAQVGVNECINNFQQGQSAIFYDASSIAGSMEADESPVKGKVGYVAAPVEETTSGGWLWTWAWAIQNASQKKDAAWKFISWATSKEYEETVGEELGWAQVPAGKRASLYENTQYTDAASAFWKADLDSVENAPDPANPGVQPRPYLGVQFVGIPEFPDLGDQVAQLISSAVAGQISVDDALQQSQTLAQAVGDKYKK
ncbi:sugar ABC transporter substrate-binding protein [Microbacterium sp. 5K110]|jgi:sorbitol/mannitol transport system substrate-binding protein|uniref:ABC transporter substrate-binding protein n=1 Tax=unclassified Microbacterium TaxID=2609290 RepID=UPI0010FF36BC|nr:sugar ABC transporter substrate-binding protein [Microbacterium sp. 5K110]TLF31058.1 sugar ABC transporter substrate-binding protein [Microbacterium sp. 5K110]